MLYVFHVNLGHMLTFDMKLALETVNVLNDAIEQQYNIKGSHQVLLVSGGAVLRQSTRVCSYTAGTDTNPIFMFSRPEGQINIQPWPSIENNDTEIKEQIVHCFNLPATYETVVKRAELALQICEMAKDEFKICEKLVHEQHLQQQGWSAVMANMEDLTNEFQKRLDNFSNVFHEHLKRRDEYLEFLSHFNKDLHKLAKIPIFSNLLLDGPNAKEFNLKFTEYLGDVVETLTPVVVDGDGAAAADADAAVDAVADADEGGSDGNVDSSTLTIRTVTSTTTTTTTTTTITAAAADGSTSNENIIKDIDKNSNNINNELETSQRIRSQSPSRSRESINNNDCTQIKSKEIELRNFQKIKGITLLEWISAKENQLTLEKLAENCVKGLHQIGDASVNTLKVNVTEAIRAASQQDVREIKGLDTRLSGLDRLMFEAKRIVQEQSELSTSFQHNQLRAGNLGDTSILPDLCASHSQQLRVMAKNHKTLRDIHRRISKAKHELAENLSTRLAYVVLLQNRMSELDNKMVFFHRCLRRLQRHLIIMEQIHSAPNIYATAITEVVRRRNFSSSFLMWASDLSNHLLNLHNEETIKRKEFSRLFDDHFLMVLFPGMRDLPPTYGTQAPTIFDADLPNLNENDIERLSTYLKYLDIPLAIEQPNMKSIQEFFHQITAANSSSSSSSNNNNNNNNNNDNKNNNSNKSNDNDNNNSNNNSIDNKNISQNDEKSCSMSADSAGDSKLNENSINIPRPLDLHAHLKDGFESETDTEEFEKVGQSPIERRQISSLVTASLQHQHQLLSVDNNNQLDIVENKPETRDISTSTETPITHDIETLTEVRTINLINNTNTTNLNDNINNNNNECMKSSSITNLLPSIPEIHSPIVQEKQQHHLHHHHHHYHHQNNENNNRFHNISINNKNNRICFSSESESLSENDVSSMVGITDYTHHNIHHHYYSDNNNSSIFKPIIKNVLIDSLSQMTTMTTTVATSSSASSSSVTIKSTTTADNFIGIIESIMNINSNAFEDQQLSIYQHQQQPDQNHNNTIEFINSEFYIDESLPSSINTSDLNIYDLHGRMSTTNSNINEINRPYENNSSSLDDIKQLDCDINISIISSDDRNIVLLADDEDDDVIVVHDSDDDEDDDDIVIRGRGGDGGRENDCNFIDNRRDSVNNQNHSDNINKIKLQSDDANELIILLQENLGATKIELERVRKISNETLIYSNILLEMLRQQNDDIQKLKSFINDMRIDYERELTKLLVVIEQIRQRDVQMQRETINRLTVDHELEMNDIKKLMYSKDEEIHGLKLTTENLCDRIKELESMENNEMKLLREKVIALENEKLKFLSIKDKELNEQRDKLQRDHKTEVESLRSRFKLMTSRDRTPSETSLEKIERPDLLDLGGIESMSSIGGSGVITIDHRLSRHTGGGGGGGLFGSPKSPSSGSTGAYDLYKKILEEKERQLDILRENEQRLVKENSQMKNNLQKVMNAEMASALDEDQHHHHKSINFESGVIAAAADAAAAANLLKEQMKVLAKEKEKLEIELCMQRSKKSEMDCSVAMIKGMEASPNRLKSMCAKPCVNIESCTKGDLVIVVWDSEHGQYKILQETPLLYFLHADSHPSLNLIPGTTSSSSSSSSSASAAAMLAISSSPNTNICATSIQVSTSPTNPIQSSALSSASLPKSLYCIGRVIEKEFCYARKDENRYKVTKGTKFYRVKVRPRSPVRGSITTGGGGGNESGPLKVRKGISFDAEKSSQITTAGDGSLSVPVSRSTSTNLLINSFAQTDLLDPVNEDNVFITSTSTTTATTTTTTTIKTSQQTTDKSSLINKIKTSIQQIGNIDDSNFTNVTTATTHKSNQQNPITVAPPITSSPIVKQKQKFIDVDMIDSGVEAQQKIIYKERNSVSETDNNDKDEVDGGGGGGGGDGEPLSFTTFTQELTSSTAIAAATTTATATVTTTSSTIEGAQQSSYYNQARHRYISVSEEDENILDNVSSSHCETIKKSNNNNKSDYKKSIGIFTLIEPLILPIQLALDD